MSISVQQAGTQKKIPRGSASLFANADFFIGSALMSPMAAMLVSACWWAVMDRQVFTRQYKLAGVRTGEYLWLWALAVGASLFLVGAAVILPKWIAKRGVRGESLDLEDDDQVLDWIAISNKVAALLLAPPLLTLLWVLVWTWVDTYRGVQSSSGTLPIRYQDLRLFFGPAFNLGCTIALASRISLVLYSLRHSQENPSQPPLKMPSLVKIGATIGGLLLLPALTMVIVVCWDTLLARTIGIRPRGGLTGMINVMIRMAATLGPANFIGCMFLLCAGNEWLEHWCHNVRIRGLAPHYKSIKPSLSMFAKVDAIVGAVLMSPALAVVVVSAWVTFRRTFGRFPDGDFRRLFSGDMMSVLAPCIVVGCVLLLCSVVAWWFTHTPATKTISNVRAQGIPRLVKLGAIIGAMLLSPVPALLLAIGWEALQERFYPDIHLAKVSSTATYVLEDASDLFGSALAVGILFVALSAVGYCVSGIIHFFHKKPVTQMAQSFDDL